MLILSLAVVAAAIYLLVRRIDPRLVLLGAGLALALLAGQPLLVADTFTRAMVAGAVAPICAAMGFAAVLTATGCDRHLVHLLLAPVTRARALLLPGGIVAAYVVNAAVPSQTSTAAALGPVLVPLLLAAGYGAEVAGAALILGASFGGDLLNPGAQDIQALSGATGIPAAPVHARVFPAGMAGIAVAAVVFAVLNRQTMAGDQQKDLATAPEPLRVQPLKALVPLVPILLLLTGYGGWEPLRWIVAAPEGDPLAGALPVVRAMLIGTVLALCLAWRELQGGSKAFFEGMGAAYGTIISLTIAAQCFGAGIAAAGISRALLALVGGHTASLFGLSAAFPWALALLSGSGSGPVLAFAQTVLVGLAGSPEAPVFGALACLGGAFGRTMSPVAAVVIYAAALVGVSPVALVKRLLPALATGAAVAIATVCLR